MHLSPSTLLIAVFSLADCSSAGNTKRPSSVTTTPSAIPLNPKTTSLSSTSFSLTSLPLTFPNIAPVMSLALNSVLHSTQEASFSRQISRSPATKEPVYFTDQVASQVEELALKPPPSQTKLTKTVSITVAHLAPSQTPSSKSATITTVTSYVLVVPLPIATAYVIPEGEGQGEIFTNGNSTFRQFDDKPVHHDDSRRKKTWLLPLLISFSIIAGFIFGSGFWCYYRKNERIIATIHDMSTFPDIGTVSCVLKSPFQLCLLTEIFKQSRAWWKCSERPQRLNMNLAQNWSFNRPDLESHPGPPYPHGQWARDCAIETHSSPLSSATTVVDHSQHMPVHYPDPTVGNTPIRPRALTDPLIPRLPSYEAALKGDDGARYVSPLPMSGAYPSTVRSRPSTSSAPTSLSSEGWRSAQSSLGGVNTLSVHTRSVQSARSNYSVRRTKQMQSMDAGLRHIGIY
jgi:hypothetical protein